MHLKYIIFFLTVSLMAISHVVGIFFFNPEYLPWGFLLNLGGHSFLAVVHFYFWDN